MDEFGLIERYFARARRDPSVRVGIGDDGAVLAAPGPGKELVAATDTLIDGVHFPTNIDAWSVGWRAVMVNLSDFAAMGADPRWMTLALSLPDADPVWLDGFASGLFAAAAAHGVVLVGGDTTRSKTRVISVQVLGDVPEGEAILRSTAEPGDRLYVTGTPGDAAAGCDEFGQAGASEALRRRFLQPRARVAFGRRLRGLASSAIDLSDGLYADLGRLLAASGAGAVLDLDRLPLSAELAARYPRAQRLRFALSGGDDYELLFTVASECVPATTEHRLTEIGRIVEGTGIACRDGGKPVAYSGGGYRHFT